MTKRFTITQNGDLFTVRDTVKNKPMGVFEFKEDEFPVYFCFHKIIDLMNDLNDENEELKQQCEDFIKILDNIITAYVDLLNESWEENEQLKQKIKSIVEILKEDIGYIESFRKIEEVLK